MTSVDIIHITHHLAEMILSFFLVYASYLASKKLGLIILRKGWYLVSLGSLVFALVAGLELLIAIRNVQDNPALLASIYIIHTSAFILISAGILFLACYAGRIWRH